MLKKKDLYNRIFDNYIVRADHSTTLISIEYDKYYAL